MAKHTTLTLIGDEIYWDGELVALTVARGDDTLMSGFREFIADPLLTIERIEEELNAKCGCHHEKKCPRYKAEDGPPEHYDDALQDVARVAKEYAKGGLLRMTDLAILLSSLKESK